MYQEVLLKYARNSGFKHDLDPSEIRVEKKNPQCGDQLAFAWELEDGRVRNLRFDGQGCAISLAAAAVFCESLNDQPLTVIAERIQSATDYFDSQGDWSEDWGAEGLPALGAVREFPMRMACVKLAWAIPIA